MTQMLNLWEKRGVVITDKRKQLILKKETAAIKCSDQGINSLLRQTASAGC